MTRSPTLPSSLLGVLAEFPSFGFYSNNRPLSMAMAEQRDSVPETPILSLRICPFRDSALTSPHQKSKMKLQLLIKQKVMLFRITLVSITILQRSSITSLSTMPSFSTKATTTMQSSFSLANKLVSTIFTSFYMNTFFHIMIPSSHTHIMCPCSSSPPLLTRSISECHR